MKAPPVARRLTLLAVLILGIGMARSAWAAAPPNPTSPGGVAPATDARESDLAARDLFQSRRYAEALAIYRRLYAETHHPTYLRNIGRCHQMMREPDAAIDNFRAYLRDAHELAAEERQEIDVYIDEMQRLRAGAVAAALPSSASGSPTSTSTPPPWFPGTVATARTTSDAPEAAAPPITHRWWFWTGIGVLAVTGLIAAITLGGTRDRLPCPAGAVCPP